MLHQKFLALVALSLPLVDTISYMGKSCVIGSDIMKNTMPFSKLVVSRGIFLIQHNPFVISHIPSLNKLHVGVKKGVTKFTLE
jgi:hypothetical protein